MKNFVEWTTVAWTENPEDYVWPDIRFEVGEERGSPEFWQQNLPISGHLMDLSLIGEKSIYKYISSGYAIMSRENNIRVHTHVEFNSNNNNSINSYLFAC
jgi:hypothetical protein